VSEDFRRRFQQAAAQIPPGPAAVLVLVCPEHARALTEDPTLQGMMRCPAAGCQLAVMVLIEDGGRR
jgi:hypothetical protein